MERIPKSHLLLTILACIAAACRLAPVAITPPPTTTQIPVAPTPTATTPPATPTATASPAPTPTIQKPVYYVAPTGNDSSPGTLDEPWLTIHKAADMLEAGETVYIRAGTYHERLIPKNSGRPGNEITYAAYPGEAVTIDGEGVSLPDDLAGLVEVNGQSYIRISGLRVINAGPFSDNAAIMVHYSSNVTIEKNTTYNTTSSGIGAWESQNITIDGNTVELGGTGGYQECITVAISRNFEVLNNRVVDCQKEGITLKDGSFDGRVYRNVVKHSRAVGIYVDASAKPTGNIQVFQNIAFDSVKSSGFTIASEVGGMLTDIRLENNIAYHNFTYGIEISRCCKVGNPADSHPMDSIVIINNTLYDNGIDWGGGLIADNPQALNVVIRNNICSQNLTFQLAVAADVPKTLVIVDHNLIDGYRGYEDEVYGDDYVEGNPLFVEPANQNFHLQPGSPAEDAGSATGAPEVDFDDYVRPQDGNRDGTALPDMGAHELGP